MKLHLKRDQAKKLMGGVKFEISARVELDDEEKDIDKRYKAYKEVLHWKEKKIPFTERVIMFKTTIESFTAGQTYKCDSINEIIEYEEAISEACKNFYLYLGAMKQFGGEEIISYPEALETE